MLIIIYLNYYQLLLFIIFVIKIIRVYFKQFKLNIYFEKKIESYTNTRSNALNNFKNTN